MSSSKSFTYTANFFQRLKTKNNSAKDSTISDCLSNDKKTLNFFGPKTWCTKNPSGYRTAHHFDTF